MIKTLEENGIKNCSNIILDISEEEKNEYFNDEDIKQVADKFKFELEKLNNENKNDNKKINFELKTGDPKEGISFELFTIETKELFRYINMNIDYIKNSFSVLSIQFKVKNEDYVKTVESFYYEFIEPQILKAFAKKKMYDLSMNCRAEGTNIFIEVVSQNGRYIKPVLSFGLDPSKLGEYSLSMGFRTKLKVSDIFCSSNTCEEIVSLFYNLIIYLKGESKNLSHVVDASMNAMNALNLTNGRFQRKLEDYLRYISIAMDLISANTEIKATPKYVIKETTKSISQEFPKKIKKLKDFVKIFKDNETFGDIVKGIIYDSIDICYGIPNKQVGFLFCIRLPGLTSEIDTF